MRFLLLFITFIAFIDTNAQLQKGHYVLVKEQNMHNVDYNPSFNQTLHCTTKDSRSVFPHYFCASLDVFDDKHLYLHTRRIFDSGNTYSETIGDYVVELIPKGMNSYMADNKLITLLLNINAQNDIEIKVIDCVASIHSSGIIKSSGNYAMLDTNKTYLLTKESDIPHITISQAKENSSESIEKMGINYGNYKVTENEVVWQGPKKRRELGESVIEGVDVSTFDVFKLRNTAFYVIHENSVKNFPVGYTEYAKDCKHIYYEGKVLGGVDPLCFSIVDPLYGKTDKVVYYKNCVVTDADVTTFESLNGGYGKGKKNYFYAGKIVKRDKHIKKLLKRKK